MSVSVERISRRKILAGAGSVGAAVAMFAHAPTGQAMAATLPGAPHSVAAVGLGVKDRIRIASDGGTTVMEVFKVRTLSRGKRPSHLPDPFTLVFQHVDGPVLDSGTHLIERPTGKRMAMFISPVSENAARFEAAFN